MLPLSRFRRIAAKVSASSHQAFVFRMELYPKLQDRVVDILGTSAVNASDVISLLAPPRYRVLRARSHSLHLDYLQGRSLPASCASPGPAYSQTAWAGGGPSWVCLSVRVSTRYMHRRHSAHTSCTGTGWTRGANGRQCDVPGADALRATLRRPKARSGQGESPDRVLGSIILGLLACDCYHPGGRRRLIANQ